MAKVYKNGREVEGEYEVTPAQAKAKAKWDSNKSPEAKQANAEARQAARAMRTPQQQIAELDRRLGKGIGAVRERARLSKEVAR